MHHRNSLATHPRGDKFRGPILSPARIVVGHSLRYGLPKALHRARKQRSVGTRPVRTTSKSSAIRSLPILQAGRIVRLEVAQHQRLPKPSQQPPSLRDRGHYPATRYRSELPSHITSPMSGVSSLLPCTDRAGLICIPPFHLPRKESRRKRNMKTSFHDPSPAWEDCIFQTALPTASFGRTFHNPRRR